MKRVMVRGQADHVCFVDSDTERDVEYQIARLPSGAMKCACISYVFNREKPKSCKHLKALGALSAMGGMRTDGGVSAIAVTQKRTPKRKEPAMETFKFRRAITFGAVPGGTG